MGNTEYTDPSLAQLTAPFNMAVSSVTSFFSTEVLFENQ
jgi:hypothetical protein